MEEERQREEIKAEKEDVVKPHTLLVITDGENASEGLIFCSITKDRYHVRLVPELQNKYVACCYGGLLVLRDKSSDDCSILNFLTMERMHLPPLNTLHTDCVISSPKMDGSCRVIFFEQVLRKCWSCHLGDSEFMESTFLDGLIIQKLINFNGKLYALTAIDWNLFAFDFSDPDLHPEQVVSGESLTSLIFTGRGKHSYLVESCEDLLLIVMGNYDYEVCDVKIFRADFSTGEWVKLETLGDRAVFLGSPNNTFSSPATSIGMKGNAIYWVRIPYTYYPPKTHLCMYDIEDESISTSLPFPIVGTPSSLSWVSVPMNCEEEKQEQKDMSFSFEDYSPIETIFHVEQGKAAIESTELQIEQRKTKKREETEAIVKKKESVWADLQNDLLLEIFPHLFAGDAVAFRTVCRSWYSVFPSPRTSQKFVLPLHCPSPLLMCPDKKAYDPIHGELYSIDFPDIPGAKIRAARDGWLLMDLDSTDLFFYKPFTKATVLLPDCNARSYISVYFSASPTSANCVVVVAANRMDNTFAICFMKCGDEAWTCREISPKKESFYFSACNVVVCKGLYYFLGLGAKLLIFNPNKDEVRTISAPKFISQLKGQQYMLESDGKVIAIFLGMDGSSLYTCEWNVCRSKWEILGSLGNIMLFVSRPLSLCKRATVSGTGNKIYFPRVVGDGHILFYSLATRRYHTFEMGTSYTNFFASKFYPEYNGWFMP